MNQNNTPGSGFMYFTNHNTQQPTPDTSDFLAFTKTNLQTNYDDTGQLPRYRPSLKQKRWTNNRKSDNRKTLRRGGFNNSFSPKNISNNGSFFDNSSSFNDSGNNSSFGCNSFSTSFEKRRSFNQNAATGELFLHPSFVEDPWAELIRKAEQRKQAKEDESKSLD